jgi:L-alanine-DL-glutamate epimerase-like enolase superfamily enzyme
MSRRSFLGGIGAVGGVLSLPGLARAIQETSSPYRRPKLKITDVRTAQVQAHGPQVHVRIYTDQGLIGQGEATDAAVGAPPLVNGPFKRFLVGQDRSTWTTSSSASGPSASSRGLRPGST